MNNLFRNLFRKKVYDYRRNYVNGIKYVKYVKKINYMCCENRESYLCNKKKYVNKYTDVCKFCKGIGFTKCMVCDGNVKIYKDNKEYNCYDCSSGVIRCIYCDGSGVSHHIF